MANHDGEVPTLSSLTGIRAVAAAWVFGLHLNTFVAAPEWIANTLAVLFEAGSMGVDLFFVLSGFIISHAYNGHFSSFDWKRMASFLNRRLARIYPVHIFTLAVMGGFYGFFIWRGAEWAHDMVGTRAAAENLLLIHSWFPGREATFNHLSWSISAEWAAYLAFPFLALAVIRGRLKRWAALLYIFIAVFGGWMLSTDYIANPDIFRIAIYFPAGMLVYHFPRNLPVKQSTLSAAGMAILVLGIGGATALHHFQLSPWWAAGLFGPAVWLLGAAPESGVLARPFSVFWGKVSYSTYMTHNIAFAFVVAFLDAFGIGESVHWTAKLSLLVLGGLAAAVLTFWVVERPSRQGWLRATATLAGRRRKSYGPVAPAASQAPPTGPPAP